MQSVCHFVKFSISVCVISRFDFIFYRREILFAKDKWVKCVYSKVIPIKWRTWRFMNEKKVPPFLWTETAEKAFPPSILWAYFSLISSVETLQQPWLPDKFVLQQSTCCARFDSRAAETQSGSVLSRLQVLGAHFITPAGSLVCELWISHLTIWFRFSILKRSTSTSTTSVWWSRSQHWSFDLF